MSTSIRIRTAQRGDLDALVAFSVALALESEGARLDRATVTKGIDAVLKDPRPPTMSRNAGPNPGPMPLQDS